ncbi:MAG: hypothetical protein WC967_13655 [Balneolaceae bacterium]
MIEDNQIQEACKEVDILLLTKSNKTLIKETTDALITLNKDKKALHGLVNELLTENSRLNALIDRYRITFVVFVGLILLLLVL